MHGMMNSLKSFSMRCRFVFTLPTTRQKRPVGEDFGSAEERGEGRKVAARRMADEREYESLQDMAMSRADWKCSTHSLSRTVKYTRFTISDSSRSLSS